MSPRPEIVLPPGFALRIDYDPESSPASLRVTAYRDDAPVAQANLNPHDVGLRLRLEVDEDGASAQRDGPRLRLTPQHGTQAVVMGAVRAPVPPREAPPEVLEVSTPDPAVGALRELARDVALHEPAYVPHPSQNGHHSPLNAVVWLENGCAVVLPAATDARPRSSLTARIARGLHDDTASRPRTWARVQRALRALSAAASDLLPNPLGLREADESWISWRGSWRDAQSTSGVGE